MNAQMIKRIVVLSILIGNSLSLFSQQKAGEFVLKSPDGKLEVAISNSKDPVGRQSLKLSYSVRYSGKQAIAPSAMGIDRQDQKFSQNLSLVSASPVKLIDENYTLKSGKRLGIHNLANEQIFTFQNSKKAFVELIVRACNDGVAFRYRFPGKHPDPYKVTGEATTFSVPAGGKAWIHPYDWNSRLKPSYEQYCENEIAIGSSSPNPKGWAYPMLFNTNHLWIMITEAVLDGTYCGTHIRTDADGKYKVVFAEKEEVILPDDSEPVSSLPWATPWRVIVVGEELAQIVETNIVQNLNEPCAVTDVSWIRPGRSSWSWWSDGGSARSFEKQIKYADFSAEMGWEYMLIDAGWPEMTGGKVEDVIGYANKKGVGVWLWYHSGAGMPKDPLTVRNVMSNTAERKNEFAKLEKWGVKGVKVDFFDTDKQGIVKLYKEILQDAADHHIMVNFHGASLPRGLERTYPNLMTTEAIKGAEGFGNQDRCDKAAGFNAVVPFTRNVVGSMDYTPVTFSNKVRQGVETFRKTTMAHQLALAVVFESGVQNFADKAESYRALPEKPLNFMKTVPTVWDETHLVAGYPGDYVVMARRSGSKWYLAGINGKAGQRNIIFRLPYTKQVAQLECIGDGNDMNSFGYETIKKDEKNNFTVKLLGNGGFVSVYDTANVIVKPRRGTSQGLPDARLEYSPGNAPKYWSVATAESVMIRYPDYREAYWKPWSYVHGYLFYGFEMLYKTTGDRKYLDFIKKYIDNFVDEKGNFHGDNLNNLDNLMTGASIVDLYGYTHDERYKIAANQFRKVFDTYPRSADGQFWHGAKSPNMWIDGVFMGQMFLIRYGKIIGDTKYCYDEAAKQISVCAKHLQKGNSGLYLHGWTEKPELVNWADPKTGVSPEAWSEGMGWVALVTAELLAEMPKDHPQYKHIRDIYVGMAAGLKRTQDPKSGGWFMIVDKGDQPDNWIDPSGTGMFVYFIQRGIDLGLIKKSEYAPVVAKGYRSLISFGLVNDHGLVDVTGGGDGIGIKKDYATYVNYKRMVNAKETVGGFLWGTAIVEKPGKNK